jgi:anaerobic selenocysteine-containing dehydrogenase
MNKSVKSVCRMCHGGCGVYLHVKGERVVGIDGDPADPYSRGYLCSKARASIELQNHPDRLTAPLRRIGQRGKGKFETISWEEALDEIAGRCFALKEHPESLVLAQGTDRNYQEWVFRLANSFGTPNVAGPAHVCFYPRIMAGIMTYGAFTFGDYEGETKCIVCWGSNKKIGSSDGVVGIRLTDARKHGAKLIVVDPRKTSLAREADLHLQVKPRMDLELALGIIHQIITRKLYDADFVETYTTGFSELAEHVAGWTAEATAIVTGVDAEKIEKAAIMYAENRPAILEAGSGVSQTERAFDTERAIMFLSGLCANMDIPGGDVLWTPLPILGRRTFPLSERLPKEQVRKRLGAGRAPMLGASGWALYDAVWDAILKEDPYKVEALLVFGSNILISCEDSARVYSALERVDFMAVSDLFLTPTAMMADFVLPANTWMEQNQVVEFNAYIAPRVNVVDSPIGKSNEEIIIELAKRLGLSGDFWNTVEDALNAKLSPIGLDWESFVKTGLKEIPARYRKYAASGFPSLNGKYNFSCTELKNWGLSPLPGPMSPPKQHTADPKELSLISYRQIKFFNSEFRNLSSLGTPPEVMPVDMHPETAGSFALSQGEIVELVPKGKDIRMKVKVNLTEEIAVNCVGVVPLSWDPNDSFNDSWTKLNINMLTDAKVADPAIGASRLRGITVTIQKSEAV